METYDTLRYFASLASLVAMFVLFILVVLFLFRPGAGKLHDETKNMIFRNDDKPSPPEDNRRDKRQEEKEAR